MGQLLSLMLNLVKLSPDGRQLITSGDDQTIRLWDVSTSELLLIIPTREGLGIDFTDDGNYIAVGDLHSVKLYPLSRDRFEYNAPKLFLKDQKDAGMILKGFSVKNIESFSELR